MENKIYIMGIAIIVLFLIFAAWFVYSWIDQSITHNKYLRNLRTGDHITYIDDYLQYSEAKFWRFVENGVEIIDNDGKVFRIDKFQIVENERSV